MATRGEPENALECCRRKGIPAPPKAKSPKKIIEKSTLSREDRMPSDDDDDLQEGLSGSASYGNWKWSRQSGHSCAQVVERGDDAANVVIPPRQFRPVMTQSGKNVLTVGGHHQAARREFVDAERAPAGIGIIFSCQELGGGGAKLVVESLLHNGAAWNMRDGIRKGDVLVEVDGTSVDNMQPYDLGGLILGPAGSVAVLDFERQVSDVVADRTVRFRCEIIRRHNERSSNPYSSASSPGTDSRSHAMTVSGASSDA